MTNPQGTQWESELVAKAKQYGFKADRFPKRGQKGEPDLYFEISGRKTAVYPVVAWKRLVGKKGDGPRQPDGERRVVIVPLEDFLEIASGFAHSEQDEWGTKILVQAKWTTNLNVTRVLGQLVDWMKHHGTTT